MKAEDLHSLCTHILESDKSIRFVGIPNKMGKQIISCYRTGVAPLLTPSEIEMFAIESVLRMKTITLENKEYPILMASFDLEADHDNIIVNKILPLINELGL
jgi:hypothetical protein